MKIIKVSGIIPCPLCGGKVIVRCNASKLFQVKCTQCGSHTIWTRKTEAVVQWYNMIFQHWRNTGKITD